MVSFLLQSMGAEAQREVVRGLSWDPTVDDMSALMIRMDNRAHQLIIEQALSATYTPSMDFLLSVSHLIQAC